MTAGVAGVVWALVGLALGLGIAVAARRFLPALTQRKSDAAQPVLSSRQQIRKQARQTDKRNR